MIWLASRSPRRKHLLERAGYALHLCPTDVDETMDSELHPTLSAQELAQRKAEGVVTDHVVLAADTLVHMEHEVLGKPAHREEAEEFLRRLSGQWHEVTTGVCLRHLDEQVLFHCTTRVKFRPLIETEIIAYVATGEADDKAGAYGIQSGAAAFVSEVQGSWTNVVGLPLEACIPVLDRWEVPRGLG